MKLTFLKIKTNSYLKKNRSLRASLPYMQASKVGIIFTVEDKMKHDKVKEFIKNLERDGKQAKVICFLPRDKQNYEFLFDFFTEKELSLFGNIDSECAKLFTETPFDFLFYFDTEPNPLILNLIAKSKAKCRVGKHWDGSEGFFEMMVETGNPDPKAFIDTVSKYARGLK
jgi:hypothetical protein